MSTVLSDAVVMTDGLMAPEGPVALADGSVLVVEMRSGRLIRVAVDGQKSVVAEVGGGPNGATRGPDGAIYVCNNGGGPGLRSPSAATVDRGSIQRVDPDSGAFSMIYDGCDGTRLARPNDLVFDRTGNFWFTDFSSGSVYYASPSGDRIELAWTGLTSPNGIGLSPDERTLYVALTNTRQVMRRRIASPGVLEPSAGYGIRALVHEGGMNPDVLLAGLTGGQELDSLAIEADGSVCVATLLESGINVISPDGERIEKFTLPAGIEEYAVTNICFGGSDLQTAYITLSLTGRLLRCRWPRPGLRLNFQE